MGFVAGLLPGFLVGVLIGFAVTTIARHARELAKALVKGALVLGYAFGRVARALRVHLDELVSEARTDLDKPQDLEDTLVPPRHEPPTRGFGGPYP